MLIDSENLIARIDKCYQESAKTGLGLEPVMAIRDIKALISVMPKVDAAPVKNGKWFDAMIGELPVQVCDQCSTFFPLAYTGGGHHYCPNCGAKMDLEG
jgi:hypothetical protein